MKYWTIDKTTREVVGGGDTDKWNMPRNVLLVEPFPEKAGFAVVAMEDLSGTQYIADYRGKIIYSTANPSETKTVTALGEIKSGWTLNKPKTEFDVWKDGEWVTDKQAQYEDEYQRVNSTRENLYVQIVDRLNNEAEMIRRVEKDEAKAAECEAQADAAYLKIREDNPWPAAPCS
ncbi:hypothetical protein CSW98_15890 [Vibrio sp. HA2012]|uniref:hypothetical protein n=1 Tax=Vibrio sp. HA2012 TaxID=1971595 RepID=UPI000C2C8934|nr:hypothetical protein [Vibrio sp. HA2012]PJC85308.1 hypothetical protein CSW98_15890 [Vibrio sp. HA2012]